MLRKLTLFLFLCSLLSAAQAREDLSEKAQQKAYGEARKLAERAAIQLKAGNSRFADELIRQSIETFPTTEIYDYAKEIMRGSDIRYGNELMELNFKRLQGLQTERVAMPFTSYSLKFFSTKGDIVIKYSMMKKVTIEHEHAINILKVNKGLGNHEFIGKAYQRLMENLLEYKTPLVVTPFSKNNHTLADDMYYKPRMIEQFHFRMEYYMFFNKHQEALRYISERPEKGFVKKDEYEQALVRVLTDMGRYDEALATARDMDKDLRDRFIGYVKLHKGETDLPQSFVNAKFAPRNTGAISPGLQMAMPNLINGPAENAGNLYDHGLYLMNRKDFSGAAEKFGAATGARRGELYFGFSQDVYPWKIHKALGDAYAALRDVSKARESYQNALKYYPDFRPAADALANL